MYPIIFNYKMLTIGGYGIMLGIAFYCTFLLLEREFKHKEIDPDLAYRILLTIIPCGIIGAKLFHILDNLDIFSRDPMGMIFSGSGLSVYGGFILALIVSAVVIKKSGENVLDIFDCASPSMALGYGIGRMGCHVAGDGCYGIQTSSFLGTAYPNGIVPTTAEVFPTPLFESFVSLMILILLLKLRKKELKTGTLFFIYLILNGIARFSVEFIRLNPEVAFGFSQAQIVAFFLFITGVIGLVYQHKSSIESA